MGEGTWTRLIEGLPTLIGVAKTDGCRAGYVYDEDSASILTGPFKLTAYKDGFADAHETEQLACRMKYWMFNRPAPCQRNRSFKPCPPSVGAGGSLTARGVGRLSMASCRTHSCET